MLVVVVVAAMVVAAAAWWWRWHLAAAAAVVVVGAVAQQVGLKVYLEIVLWGRQPVCHKQAARGATMRLPYNLPPGQEVQI